MKLRWYGAYPVSKVYPSTKFSTAIYGKPDCLAKFSESRNPDWSLSTVTFGSKHSRESSFKSTSPCAHSPRLRNKIEARQIRESHEFVYRGGKLGTRQSYLLKDCHTFVKMTSVPRKTRAAICFLARGRLPSYPAFFCAGLGHIHFPYALFLVVKYKERKKEMKVVIPSRSPHT